MTYIIPDLDIDISEKSRVDVLSKLHHIPASKINDKGISPHGVGAYFCDIPEDRISHLASIDYKNAEDNFGYIKVDILHNSVYDNFESREEIENILNQETDWNKIYKKDVLEKLPHISNYYTLLNKLPKINSIEKLAMFIAVIRPAKKYLIEEAIEGGWEAIEDRIWVKEGEGYMYKKSHALAYAMAIIVAMSQY